MAQPQQTMQFPQPNANGMTQTQPPQMGVQQGQGFNTASNAQISNPQQVLQDPLEANDSFMLVEVGLDEQSTGNQ
ncbi:hypothetical protein IE53DRAFT_367899 [Violaceomyces palustris]|uniref:Uncharacterized protein n=1 Tax=Violaceomyces palustris TaxID=1673888 RepID=A0ACD0P0P6_9BASI|nr:hypothetical protein IE53DRAFT_367899 [Violaceomyces palustris]